MRLNNKGLTLIELVISVALVSIVVVFLYTLLIDINKTLTTPDFAIDNQNERLEIIKTVHNDLVDTTITRVSATNQSIELVTSEGNVKFSVTSTTVSETNSLGLNVETPYHTVTYKGLENTTKWTLDNVFKLDELSVCYFKLSDKTPLMEAIYILKWTVPVYTMNELNDSNNNNVIDDLTFSIIGNHSFTGVTECTTS